MTFSDIVCGLELCKKLENLGIKHNGMFYWVAYSDGTGDMYTQVDYKKEFDRIPSHQKKIIAPAYTFAELGKLLPYGFHSGKESDLEGEVFVCTYSPYDGFGNKLDEKHSEYSAGYCHENESDSRAKMLIWYTEKKYMKK